MKLSLKNRANQRPYISKPLDLLLAAAATNGYACSIYYGELPKRAAGRRALQIKVSPDNLVTRIK